MKAYHFLVAGLMAVGLAACSSMPNTVAPQTQSINTEAKLANEPSVSFKHVKPVVITGDDVDVSIHAFVVRQAHGKETLEPVLSSTQIHQGDVIEYRALMTNKGKDRVRSMLVELNIPQGVAFTGVVEPDLGTQASLDGSRFLYMPIRVNVEGVVQNVDFADYRSLRWNVEEVGIGATAVVKYRATVQ